MEIRDLFQVTLRGDNIRHFIDTWDWVLGGMKYVPAEKISRRAVKEAIADLYKVCPSHAVA